MSAVLPARVRRALFLRSFLIQGSWNYRTMIGSGMAWALLPLFRHLERTGRDGTPLGLALARHVGHFNSHPYLATLALGSLARLEADGEDEAVVQRFRAALPGPLGGLGDRVVWAGWLPFVSLWALALYWAGLTPWLVVALFLTVYNIGHLALRFWGLQAGLAEGQRVGSRLRTAALAERAQRLSNPSALLVGVVAGLLLLREGVGVTTGWSGALAAAAGFVAGAAGGDRLWRPAALVTVIVLAVVFLAGLSGWTPSPR